MNNSFPLVTAIITTHNRLDLLKRAIESVKNQTYPNIELIVVSDNSTDGTNEWAKNQDFKFIHIPKEESKGGNYARNLGIKNSSGKYVAFLDDDDYWLPEKIKRQVDILESTDNKVVFCKRKFENVKGDFCSIIDDNTDLRENSYNLKTAILYRIYLLTSGTIVERDLLMQLNGFDENCRFWQEYELSIRLAQHTNFYYIEQPLFVYRNDLNEKTRLSNNFENWQKGVKYIRNKHKNLYSKLPFYLKPKVFQMYLIDSIGRARSNKKSFLNIYGRILIAKAISAIYKIIPVA